MVDGGIVRAPYWRVLPLLGWAHRNGGWVEGRLRREGIDLPERDARAALSILWSMCVDFYGSASDAVGQVIAFLDERWRWGTMENPDEIAAADPAIPASDTEKAAARGLL